MRFVIMHKTNAHWEGGALPDKELLAGVGALLGELSSAGALVAAEGLGPSSEGVRLRFADGQQTRIPGPFDRGNELPAGFSILRVASLEDAVDWGIRQAEILGDVETDIRPVTEPWDIGMASRPADDDTRRYMVLRKATAATEAGIAPSEEARSRLSQFVGQTTRTCVHLVTETMRPSRRGRRYRNARDGISFFDGPFIETKELIGGYVIVAAESLEAACRWAVPYTEIVGAEEVDVRELE